MSGNKMSRLDRLLAWGGVALLVGVVLSLLLGAFGTRPDQGISTAREGASPPADHSTGTTESLPEVPVRSAAAPIVDAPPGAHRGFDVIYRDIVACLSDDPATVSPPGEKGAVESTRQTRASELFSEMMTVVPDSGQRALGVLAGLPAPWQDAKTRIEARVCSLLIEFSLKQMTATASIAAGRPFLVRSLLTQMPVSNEFARLVRGLLVSKPYLEREHEQSLLEMAKSATGDLAFLATPVRDLLLTLWDGLKADGHQNNVDLLCYFEGVDPVLRTAAGARLLLDVRYRDLVIARIEASQDRQMLKEMADFAARKLPFAEGIEIVRALKAAAPDSHLGSAYGALAEQHPELLCEHYSQVLGESTHPRHREQVVLAAANYAADRGGREVARLAFESDSDPRVKGVALLAMAAHRPVEPYLAAFDRAIADNQDGALSDYIAASLVNAARRCDVNWLDRATQQALALPGLNEQRRVQLAALRRQYLPH